MTLGKERKQFWSSWPPSSPLWPFNARPFMAEAKAKSWQIFDIWKLVQLAHSCVMLWCFASENLINQVSAGRWLKACSHHAISTAHEQALNRHDQSQECCSRHVPTSLHEILQCANGFGTLPGLHARDQTYTIYKWYLHWCTLRIFSFIKCLLMKCLLLCWDITHWSRSAWCNFVVQVMALGDDWCGFADAEDCTTTSLWTDESARWHDWTPGNETVLESTILLELTRVFEGKGLCETQHLWGGSGASSQWLASIPWGTWDKNGHWDFFT